MPLCPHGRAEWSETTDVNAKISFNMAAGTYTLSFPSFNSSVFHRVKISGYTIEKNFRFNASYRYYEMGFGIKKKTVLVSSQDIIYKPESVGHEFRLVVSLPYEHDSITMRTNNWEQHSRGREAFLVGLQIWLKLFLLLWLILRKLILKQQERQNLIRSWRK